MIDISLNLDIKTAGVLRKAMNCLTVLLKKNSAEDYEYRDRKFGYREKRYKKERLREQTRLAERMTAAFSELYDKPYKEWVAGGRKAEDIPVIACRISGADYSAVKNEPETFTAALYELRRLDKKCIETEKKDADLYRAEIAAIDKIIKELETMMAGLKAQALEN